ncbi:MAG TPA: alkaline phosphatase D family protein, partial [Pseudonocardia sp.]|nr:alkaline phosphatase D family protein [Pseudonocardia sp.]
MSLVLGPVLRHVGESTASVWVQTGHAGTVSVLGCEARTFEVSGHHYALVQVTGLEPDSRTPYEVHLDGERVWPPRVSPFPPSRITTRGPGNARRHRIVFGSCRFAKTTDRKVAARLGIDALDAYAARMARQPVDEWPDALVLLGDQVYADELTPQNRRRIAGRRDRHPEWPDDEIVGYDEYVGLYRDSWSDPEVRWMMSTVPVAMIFDDHDVRDDWNTSAAWRERIAEKPWWRDRIRSALASYWVYQHVGNLPPDVLEADPDHRKIVEAEGDTWPLLAELADRADAEADGAKGVRFSFRWDLGRSRLVMIDSRNGRILADGAHLMLGEGEFRWVEEQVEAPGADGDVEHLVLGTSLPWLLPHAISDVQTINEIAAGRPGLRGRVAEAVRQAVDLEHWAAFRSSFDRLTRLITRAAAGTGGAPPATVSVLSGDVHHSYAARAHLPGDPPARVHQLTCSPVHNHVGWFIRPGFRLGWSQTMHRLTSAWARRTGAPPP